MPVKKASKKTTPKGWLHWAHILKVVYLYLVLFVGLVMFLINGVMVTKTFLESTVFPVEYSYVEYWQCEERWNPETGKTDSLSAEEQSECEERMRERARGERGNEVNRDYASGIAGLLFAILVWIPHFMWSRRIK